MKSDSRIVLDEISRIIKNEKNMSDIEIFNAINDIEKNYPNIYFNSRRLKNVIERRIHSFCKEKNLEISQYYGVLPVKML